MLPLMEVGKECVAAVDQPNTSCIYIVLNGQYHRCLLTGHSREYIGMEVHELDVMRKEKRRRQIDARRQETELGVVAAKRIGDVISSAVERAEDKDRYREQAEDRTGQT